MDPRPVEFYFDFSSPYAYLCSSWINDLAATYGRDVIWRPIMLGVAFKETGMRPLFHQPLRGAYGMRDFVRTARLLGLEVVVPKEFPYVSLMASRAFYGLVEHQNDAAVPFAQAAFERYFKDGITPDSEDEIRRLAARVGVDGVSLVESCQEPAIKDRLKEETAQAINRGVFGAPFVIVDGEPFWGNDRKDQIEEWLKTGGW